MAANDDALTLTDARRHPAAPARRAAATGHVWRGTLIALIVLGHNRLFASLFPDAYRLLYTFHVEAFLIIPFLRPFNPHRAPALLYPLKAYYRPFFVFVTGYALLFALSHGPSAPASAGDALGRYARALVIANSTSLNQATGFEMFWFLPVFIILATLRPLIGRLGNAGFAAVLALAAALHLTAGYLDGDAVARLPWGLPIVGYILFPCLLACAMARNDRIVRLPLPLPGLIFVVAGALCFTCGFGINLSDFVVYDARALPALIATDVTMLAAALVFFRIDSYVRSNVLDALGRCSLVIYLTHGLIGYALVSMTGHRHPWPVKLAMLAVTYPVTLGLSYVAARMLMASRAGVWLFGER